MSYFVPPGPTIPASVNFATMYTSLAKIENEVPTSSQFEIVGAPSSVAVSQDGSTAVIGNSTGVGSVSIYVNNGNNTWILQAGPLVGTGYTGNSEQGNSVGISANGNTVAVGAPANNGNNGAVWVFTRSGTTWSQQAGPLIGTGNVGAAAQGYSVAISPDGMVIVSGGYDDNSQIGATWVYANVNGTWTQQAKLVGTSNIGNGYQGFSVAITGQLSTGYTVAVGAYQDNSAIGAVWVFVSTPGSVSSWSQQQKIIPSGVLGSDAYFGYCVSISGNTLAVAGPYDNDDVGATWVFNRTGTTWTQQQKLIGTGFTYDSYQGYPAITISGDGLTILVGSSYDGDDLGAFWTFNLVNGNWVQNGLKTTLTANTVYAEYFSQTLSCNYDASIIFSGTEEAMYVVNNF